VTHLATLVRSTCGLVAMTSASHTEGRQFDPGQVYFLTAQDTQVLCSRWIPSELMSARGCSYIWGIYGLFAGVVVE
jgi:hypothetical protein